MKYFIQAMVCLFVVTAPLHARAAEGQANAEIVAMPVNGPHNEKPMPKDLQGIWSAPDCTAAEQVYVVSPHYILFYHTGEYLLGALQRWRQEDAGGDTLYNFDTNVNSHALMKKTNDGLMKIIMTGVHPKAPLSSGWGEIEDRIAPEFAHCAKLFDNMQDFGQDEVNAVFMLDHAISGCAGVTPDIFKTTSSCHQALFDLADSNHSQSLDHPELARLYRQTSFLLSAAVLCGGVGYPENSKAEAEDFASALLGSEKTISLDQLKKKLNDPNFFKTRSVHTFAENAGSLQILLPFLPAADRQRSCPLATPSEMRNLGTMLLPDKKTAP